MEYKILNETETTKEMEISVPRAELERLIIEETETVRKDLTLDGFRKGRVPRTLIRNRYAESLKAQAMDKLVRQTYLAVLREKKWQIAGQAEIKNIEDTDPIRIRLFVEVIPEFNVENYLNIEVFKEPPAPDDFLLQQGMNALQEQHATIREVNRPAVVDDLITMDVEVREKGASRNESDQKVRIGDRSLPDQLNRALVGMKVSDKKEVKVDEKHYLLSVKKIEEKNLPQIDDNFAKIMKLTNLEELKTKVLESVKKQEEKRIEDDLKESISEVLLERIKFQVPDTLIQKEYEKILKDYGMPDSDSNKERFWSVAEKRIRFNLILNKITAKEDLQVGEAEIMDLVTRMGIKLTDQNRNDVIDYLGGILNREKTLDFLFKNAKISEKSRILSPKEAANDTHTVRH
ncbi:MAG: trigger factor [candidate division WOR-3 bacterium]|nr:MAG: trigger factor [candidate division WOR-3 bacterium]